MRPTPFNLIAFALIWTAANVGLIALVYSLIK